MIYMHLLLPALGDFAQAQTLHYKNALSNSKSCVECGNEAPLRRSRPVLWKLFFGSLSHSIVPMSSPGYLHWPSFSSLSLSILALGEIQLLKPDPAVIQAHERLLRQPHRTFVRVSRSSNCSMR
ncbi:hypothetical protein F5B18DRAFT_330391 [Nemania serpens]|nr:hypothetical protein F5B18DRAFT_330391 [Nemania serpens]